MVICVFVGCLMRSDRDKGISFYRIPVVRRKGSKCKLELSIRRRAGYVAAISREDLDVKALRKYQVCSHHFLSGKPAALKDDTDIDWLHTVNLGHSKRTTRDSVEQAVMCVICHERARRRRDMQRAKQQQDIELSHQLGIFVANEIDDAIKEEVESIIDEFTVAEDATHAVAEQLLEEAVVYQQ